MQRFAVAVDFKSLFDESDGSVESGFGRLIDLPAGSVVALEGFDLVEPTCPELPTLARLQPELEAVDDLS